MKRLEGATQDDWRALLGRKVSIRFKVLNDPEHPFSEAIGVVMAVKPDETGRPTVSIVNRHGDTVAVAIDDVLAGKAWTDDDPPRV